MITLLVDGVDDLRLADVRQRFSRKLVVHLKEPRHPRGDWQETKYLTQFVWTNFPTPSEYPTR